MGCSLKKSKSLLRANPGGFLTCNYAGDQSGKNPDGENMSISSQNQRSVKYIRRARRARRPGSVVRPPRPAALCVEEALFLDDAEEDEWANSALDPESSTFYACSECGMPRAQCGGYHE